MAAFRTVETQPRLNPPVEMQPAGFVAVSRALVSAAAELVTGVQRRVIGDDKVPTARDNAWAATLEMRARHEAQAELTREIAALVARRAAHRPLANAR